MTWRNEAAALARELAQLASTGATVSMIGPELRGAVDTRRELLFHLQQVLADVRPRRLEVKGPANPLPAEALTVRQLEADPVGALQRALRVHPAPRGWDIREGHVGGPDGTATTGAASWAAADRRLVLAEQAWSEVEADRLTPAERWSVVADVAAFARVVCVLDEDLVAATSRYGKGSLAAPVWLASPRSGLWLAATEAAELAAAGWLPDWTVPGQHPDRALPMAVRSAVELPVAQDRLRLLIDGAPSISPQQVVLIATAQARLLEEAAALLRAGGNQERASWAWHLGKQLGRAVSEGHELASRFREPYTLPGQQARESARFMQVIGQRHGVSGREAAAVGAAVERVPAVLGSLVAQVGRAWRGGDWLLPEAGRKGGQGPRRWRPVRDLDAEPQLSAQLSSVAAQAVATAGLRPALPLAAREQRPELPAPRDQLRGVRRGLVRPTEPSRHGTGRE